MTKDDYVLAEETMRNSGKLAQKNNITAAKIVAEMVRTTLGPKGMDKMLVDPAGDVTVTNDGVTILQEMQIDHPAAKMLVEIAKTQEKEIGDGTTTAVVFAGELLKQSEKLLEKSIHPTVLIKGFRLAINESLKILNNIAKDISIENKELIQEIAMTAMTGKGAESSKEVLSKLITTGILEIQENGIIDRNTIRIETKTGNSIEDSELIKGIIIDKEKVNPMMPKKIDSAKIALINSPLELKETEIDAKISITSPEQMQQYIDMEEKMLINIVNKVVNSGCNVVFCQKGIDELAQNILAKNNIMAVRRVKRSDLEALSKSTGAKIISNLNDLNEEVLGYSGSVEEINYNDDEMIFVKDCKNPKTVTLLLKGASEHVLEEVKRALEDAIGDVATALKNKKVVAGAGSCEIELSRQLHKFSESLSGREQLAVKAFADSLEIIPITLAENAGLDPIDVLTEMKANHDNEMIWNGINVFTGKTMDAWESGVIEPLKIKTQALTSATEVSIMILRIDDVIASVRMPEN